jgi:hypothetical protein
MTYNTYLYYFMAPIDQPKAFKGFSIPAQITFLTKQLVKKLTTYCFLVECDQICWKQIAGYCCPVSRPHTYIRFGISIGFSSPMTLTP